MSSEIAIDIQDVSKCFNIYEAPQYRLKQFIFPRLQNAFHRPIQRYFREFWAVKNVSFTVRKGETVGIIGRNGSGKSTLLQMIGGTLTPTGGHLETFGRIAALLELGSGFNPDFSGRDNVYMNAALLGLDKAEVDRRYDDIVQFADIGDFINEPVKTYSSGMMVRLAFAVQSQVDPDILIVDEALAVGDAKFQAKCFDRLNRLKENGTSILLVTHSSEQIVTHCNRAVLLNHGEVLEIGAPKKVTNRYLDLLFGKESALQENTPKQQAPSYSEETSTNTPDGIHQQLSFTEDRYHAKPNYNTHEYRWGDGQACILDFHLEAEGQDYPTSIHTGQIVDLSFSLQWRRTIIRPIFGFTVKNKEGVTVYGANSETMNEQVIQQLGTAGETALVRISFDCRLAPGDYFISVGVASRHGEEIIPHDRRYDSIHIQVYPTPRFSGLVDLNMTISTQRVPL